MEIEENTGDGGYRMKIYISGPITGTNDHAERFRRMEEALTAAGHIVVNPDKVNANLPEGTTHREYMQTSLAMLNMCDAIIMLEGWEKSAGCNEEMCFAMRSKLTIIFEGGRGCQKEDEPRPVNSAPKHERIYIPGTVGNVYFVPPDTRPKKRHGWIGRG